MFNLRRINILIAIYSVSIAYGLVLYLFAMKFNNDVSVKAIYDYVYQVIYIGSVSIAVTPVVILFSIIPISKHNSNFVTTVHLPLSKKQIMMKGFKKILPYFICWIIGSSFIAAVLKTNISYDSFTSIYFKRLFMTILMMANIIIIDLQVIALIILSYAKDIKWYKAIAIQISINIIIIVFSFLMIQIINIDIVKGIIAFFIIKSSIDIFSIIEFIYSFKYIEKVCR